MTELSILMPCLNEEETLATCINKAKSFLEKNNVNGEVVIADNGSTDNSIKIATSLGARVVHIKEKGYGNALRGGILAAEGKYIIMADSDDSYDFINLMPYLEKLREGYDLVMGNRFKGGIKKGAMPFLHRYLGNPVLSFIGRLFFKIKIRDFHCGLRGFNRNRIIDINLVTTGMEFASEMVVKASLNHLKITEVPTILSPDGRNRPPHLNTWQDGWRHLRFLLLFSPRWLFLIPGLFFLISGIIVSSLLVVQSIFLNNVKFDIHTLLYTSTFIFIGFQFVSFYILSKIYATSNKLIPQSKSGAFWQKNFKMEYGVISGVIFIMAGITLTLKVYLTWSQLHFGNLDPVNTFRLAVPATLFLILGVQMIITSFLASLLGSKF